MSYVHNFDEPINRVNTDSFKWDYEGESGKYIPLGVADTDFKAPQPVHMDIFLRDVLRMPCAAGIRSGMVLRWNRKRSAIHRG